MAAGLAAGAIRAFHEAGLWNPVPGYGLRSEATCCRRIRCSAHRLKGSSATRRPRSVSEVAVYLFLSDPRRWCCLPCRRGIITTASRAA
ncbi:hypothetical protein LNP25_18840 [Klebsiella variicola subsp. variicola]|nr:hypothetical protein [Klebsiella variicola subsp. variicola]